MWSSGEEHKSELFIHSTPAENKEKKEIIGAELKAHDEDILLPRKRRRGKRTILFPQRRNQSTGLWKMCPGQSLL